ncbi:hypothetical protein AGMMS49574_09150 [Bacteroidia bacterium]|nr:hypothetical protein AGMMS49574_09150 [Bacteroidia bacterium]
MRKIVLILTGIALALFSAVIRGQNYTGPFIPLNLVSENIYDLIVGESSGEQAFYHVLELAPYEHDRKGEEYRGDLRETKYVYDKLKEYGLPNALVEHIGTTKTWDGVSAKLWEEYPKQAKLADYRDLAAFLAQGSASTDVTAQLVWVGRGSAHVLEKSNIKGKIVVTEASASRIQADVVKNGAIGIITYYSPRPLIDPLQIPNASIRPEGSLFCFNLPPRDGYALRDRLLAGDSIVVHAKVETTEVETDIQVTSCFIPGTDPNAEEINVSAHLFEGYVKLGANDNISGSAVILDVARTLNELINSGSIPRPKRNIRFIWIPEFSGSAAWANAHKEITSKTLCNINLDMVGLWLSKSDSYYCLQRTTMGNPHYVNDVTEALMHYVAATNKSFLATGAGRPEPIKPVFSFTGSHEPFYYSIVANYGSSDHEVFNDFGVQVPGIMMITWPDNYYHTSGDRPSILDPTQLRRAAVIAAVGAYSIAASDEDGALRIASEVSSNAIKRLALIQQANALRINEAKADSLQATYKRALFDIDAYTANEKATLQSVLELAPSSALLKKFIDAQIDNVVKTSKLNVKAIEDLSKARGERLSVAIKPIVLTQEELKASKTYPKATALAREKGYGVLRSTITRDLLTQHNLLSVQNGAEIARLTIPGTNSILDIKKSLDAQFPKAETIDEITRYLDLLKEARLVN